MSIELDSDLARKVISNHLIAVLIIDREEDAVPLANALLEGGVEIMELTLRTPGALPALKRIRAEVPDMVAGVGTVLTRAQIDEVLEAGAAFGVAPGTNPDVVGYATERGLPFGPGVCTASDIEQALQLGCRMLKFFPAEAAGGLSYLKNIAAPYDHLGVQYIPLGGINTANLDDYIAHPLVAAVGGSWLAPRTDILNGDWGAIRDRARNAVELIAEIRKSMPV